MPFSNLPDHTRTYATLSRCRGSMLACSLNTCPLKLWLTGSMASPSMVALLVGLCASSMNDSRKSCTPKVDMALPKYMGVRRPSSTFCMSSSAPSSSSSSISSSTCASRSASMASTTAGSSSASSTRELPFLPYSTYFRPTRSKIPAKRLPEPTGQFMGNDASPNSASSWSMISSGSSAGRSSLFTNVKMGRFLMRATSKSLRVWASIPLAASTSMTVLSAAESVR
mmetsp:Transcript_37472/g.95841  ORF Transcript_37472/g.95841 Transcript_37472/m.95841 type:complete len:226 (-) Transcript_37472:486-1163(-)